MFTTPGVGEGKLFGKLAGGIEGATGTNCTCDLTQLLQLLEKNAVTGHAVRTQAGSLWLPAAKGHLFGQNAQAGNLGKARSEEEE
jgi:hypothetical protein